MNLNKYTSRRKFIKLIILITAIIFAILAFTLWPTTANAEPLNVCDQLGGCSNVVDSADTGASGISGFILEIVYLLIYLSAAVAVGFVVFGGIKMITANGDGGKFEEGVKTVKYALIGLVMAIISVTIVSFISSILQGLDLF